MLDIAKTYDNVGRSYLLCIMAAAGYGRFMLRWDQLMLLCCCPTLMRR
jgi:hypothetical protein